MKQPHLILGVGELLWDVLPEGMLLGGAPANFAAMAARLGDHGVLLSRVGSDELGGKAAERLKALAVDADSLQADPAHETGRVTVTFAHGEPHYTIHQPAAWDFLELTEDWMRLAAQADAICFGTLAQRSEASRRTIRSLLARSSAACVRVFDVNLRAPFHSGTVIRESLEAATVVKMNEAEARLAPELLGLPAVIASGSCSGSGALRHTAERLLVEFPALRMVAVTRGARGSLMVTRDECDEHAGIAVEVADTIGAGDAFTAAMLHSLLRGAGLAALNEAGNRWGAWLARQHGGLPALPEASNRHGD